MHTPSLQAFVATATQAARRAAREITYAAKDLDLLKIEDKAANDFVTNADRAAEAAIIEELQRAYPRHSILCEESGLIGDPKSDYRWIVDPLDGTTNFIHGLPQYAVSIGLTYRGDIIAGVIYDVAKNELFTAAKGQGAFLDNRRIRVSETKDLRRALIGTGFPFRKGDNFKDYMQSFMRVTQATAGVRRPGAASLDLAWVAAGRYDGFWESGLSKWDIAAGADSTVTAQLVETENRAQIVPFEEWCAKARKGVLQLIAFFGTDVEPQLMRDVLPNCRAMRWCPLFADVVPADVSKAEGIDRMLESYGIALDEAMAFGDGGNDIPMLQHVGLSVAMGNAEQEVKRAASYVTTSVDDHGIARALRHFGVID